MYPFRVFVSYAHADRALAQQVVDTLAGLGLDPVWDRDIRPGTAFTDAIRAGIAGVHIFLPLITPRSQDRPWVHQETGYAMGIGVPVLPLAVGDLPGEMIAQLQALPVAPDLADLADVLRALDLNEVVLGQSRRAEPAVTVADHPEERTVVCARLANRALDAGRYGLVRQHSRLTVFTVPDRPSDDPLWDARDGVHRRSPWLRGRVREERQALERHARAAGCRLFIDPTAEQFNTDGPHARWARLAVLRDFLASMPDDRVRVVLARRPPEGNVILVLCVIPHKTGNGEFAVMQS